MSSQIIKGTITDHSSKEEYDDEGYLFLDHKFKIDNTSYVAKTPKNIRLSDNLTLIANINDNNEVESGFVKSKNFKWGKNVSELKLQATEGDQFEFTQGEMEKKRKTDSRPDDGERWSVLEIKKGRNFSMPNKISKKITKNDYLLVAFKNDNYVLIYNKTKQKEIGKVWPAYIPLLIADIGLSFYVYLRWLDGTLEKPNFYGSLIFVNFILLMFAFFNYSSYKTYKAASRFLKDKLKNGN